MKKLIIITSLALLSCQTFFLQAQKCKCHHPFQQKLDEFRYQTIPLFLEVIEQDEYPDLFSSVDKSPELQKRIKQFIIENEKDILKYKTDILNCYKGTFITDSFHIDTAKFSSADKEKLIGETDRVIADTSKNYLLNYFALNPVLFAYYITISTASARLDAHTYIMQEHLRNMTSSLFYTQQKAGNRWIIVCDNYTESMVIEMDIVTNKLYGLKLYIRNSYAP